MILKRFTSAFLGMNSVFVASDNRHGVLIDPGVYPNELKSIRQYMTDHSFQITGILFTHLHGDHFSGWHNFSGYTGYVHEDMAAITEKSKQEDIRFIRNLYQKFGFDPELIRFPEKLEVLKEGDSVEVDNNRFFFTATPGHASHHSAIIFPDLNFMATGDMLIPTTVPYVLHNPQAYLDSLKKLNQLVKDHHIDKSAPGHANFFHSYAAITAKIKMEQTYLEQLITNGIELQQAGFTGEQFQAELEKKIPVEKNTYQHRQNIKILQKELALSNSD